MATPTVLLETLYLSHSIITETPMVGTVAKNILKTGIPPKKRRDKTKKQTNKQNRFHNN